MPKVQWRIVGNNDVESDLIKWKAGGKVSHIEFIIPGTDGKIQTIGARLEGGVAVRPINYSTFAIDLRFSSIVTDEQHSKLMSFLLLQVGKPYGVTEIIDISRNDSDVYWKDFSSWICSKLWIVAMIEAGILPDISGVLGNDINLTTPTDCLYISACKFNFDGKIN